MQCLPTGACLVKERVLQCRAWVGGVRPQSSDCRWLFLRLVRTWACPGTTFVCIKPPANKGEEFLDLQWPARSAPALLCDHVNRVLFPARPMSRPEPVCRGVVRIRLISEGGGTVGRACGEGSLGSQCLPPAPILPPVPLYSGGHSGNLAHSPACRQEALPSPGTPTPAPRLCFTPALPPSVTLRVLLQQAEKTTRRLLLPSASRSPDSAHPRTSAPPTHPPPSEPLEPCPGDQAALPEAGPLPEAGTLAPRVGMETPTLVFCTPCSYSRIEAFANTWNSGVLWEEWLW